MKHAHKLSPKWLSCPFNSGNFVQLSKSKCIKNNFSYRTSLSLLITNMN